MLALANGDRLSGPRLGIASNGAGPCCTAALLSATESGDFIDIVAHHAKLNLLESSCLGMLARTCQNNSAPPTLRVSNERHPTPALFADLVDDVHSGARFQRNLHELGRLVCRRIMLNAVPMRLHGSSIQRGAARGACVVSTVSVYHTTLSGYRGRPMSRRLHHHAMPSSYFQTTNESISFLQSSGDAVMTTRCARKQDKVVLKLPRLLMVTPLLGQASSRSITIPSSQGMRKHKYTQSSMREQVLRFANLECHVVVGQTRPIDFLWSKVRCSRHIPAPSVTACQT
jgi:hypothetical protein